jgi:hypothetical protein
LNGLHGGISEKIVLYVRMIGGVAEIRTGISRIKSLALPLEFIYFLGGRK